MGEPAADAERLRDFRAGPPGVIQIQAELDDAELFVAEVWRRSQESIGVRVTTSAEAALCALIALSMLVVVSTVDADVETFVAHGQHVVLVGPEKRDGVDTITLSRFDVPELTALFEKQG